MKYQYYEEESQEEDRPCVPGAIPLPAKASSPLAPFLWRNGLTVPEIGG